MDLLQSWLTSVCSYETLLLHTSQIYIFTSFAARFISNQSEGDRLRRNVHAWLLFTSRSFISLLILSAVWHWNVSELNTERADLWVLHSFFLPVLIFSPFFLLTPQKWWMEWRFNDLYSGKASAEAGALHANGREMKIVCFCKTPAALTWKASTSIRGIIYGVNGLDEGEVALKGTPSTSTEKPKLPTWHYKQAPAADFWVFADPPEGLLPSTLSHIYIYTPILGNEGAWFTFHRVPFCFAQTHAFNVVLFSGDTTAPDHRLMLQTCQ